MFLLAPLNAITSVNFYRKAAEQKVGRTIAYVAYVSLLFSIAGTIALKVRFAPRIEQTFVWLSHAMPTLTIQGGKVVSSVPGPVTLRNPELFDFALTIDTTRFEPVTAEMLESGKVLGYLTGNALYLRGAGGVETYDFSKAALAKPVVVDGAFYQDTWRLLSRVMYPLTLIAGFLVVTIWKLAAALFYTLLALMLNGIAGGGLPFFKLFNLASYAQTLVIALEAIFLFMPVGLPAFPVIAMISTGVYLWLAIKRLNAPSPTAA